MVAFAVVVGLLMIIVFNTLTANYETIRRLRSPLGCQTKSYHVFTNVKISNCCFFFASFLIIAAAVNVLMINDETLRAAYRFLGYGR